MFNNSHPVSYLTLISEVMEKTVVSKLSQHIFNNHL